jgi:ABC-type dipeptide/oligopeptide/nickel transport system permease subunit
MRYRDIRWAAAWVAGTAALWTWNLVFLNRPALARVSAGFFNTFAIALLVAAFTLGLGWAAAIGLHSLDIRGRKTGYLLSLFAFNLVRSVPQIVGILFGYVGVAWLREHGLPGPLVFPLLALCISMFIFPELVDLMRDRIGHYRASDFYNAMRVCGITERRIVNFHILWRNSRVHIFNKLISVFGMAVFLQCSVDFIISVGLTLDVSSVSLPPTLGSVLAKIDSKQDILAIGYTVTHPAYLPKLVFRHLQGLTAAFLIVYTLLCAHRISTGFARRHRL